MKKTVIYSRPKNPTPKRSDYKVSPKTIPLTISKKCLTLKEQGLIKDRKRDFDY